MPLKFERVESSFRAGCTRVHYQDEFGQPRFFEFEVALNGGESFGVELIQQVNELLARPRPSEVKAINRFADDAERSRQTHCHIRKPEEGTQVG